MTPTCPKLPPEELERKMALFQERALEWGERIPVGVFWKAEVPTFEERLRAYLPRYPEVYPAQGPREALDLEGLLQEFASRETGGASEGWR